MPISSQSWLICDRPNAPSKALALESFVSKFRVGSSGDRAAFRFNASWLGARTDLLAKPMAFLAEPRALAEPQALAEPRALAEPMALRAASGRPACYILKKSSVNLTARFSQNLAVLRGLKGL